MACGYDHTFVGEVPNDLICVICTFVVLDPVQISSCGHRFCSACFTEFKQSNNQRSLKCPTDQKVIEVNKVFSDQAAKRTVLNFHVQCSTSDCRWVGSLKEFEEQHSATCKSKIQDDDDNVLVKHFTEKIDKLEDRIVELDREQISLRNKIFVMKNDDTVSRALAELRNQMATQKNTFEKQIEGLTQKNLELENAIGLLKKPLVSLQPSPVKVARSPCFVWSIDLKKGKRQSSPTFFSSTNGFHCQLKCRNFLQISFTVLKGPHDSLLAWPFNMNVTLTCIAGEKERKMKLALVPSTTTRAKNAIVTYDYEPFLTPSEVNSAAQEDILDVHCFI